VYFSDIGIISLILALGFAVFTMVVATLGASRGLPQLIASAKRSVLAVAFFLILASAALIASFVTFKSSDAMVLYCLGFLWWTRRFSIILGVDAIHFLCNICLDCKTRSLCSCALRDGDFDGHRDLPLDSPYDC